MIRVLTVDDSPTFRQLIRAILESDPELMVVGEARNGEEAVSLAGRLSPDIVTMDIKMPGSDGFEAASRIMSQFPCPIIMVTGAVPAGEEKVISLAAEHGAMLVLDKPSSMPNRDPRALNLINQVKALSGVKVVRRRRTQSEPSSPKKSRGRQIKNAKQVKAVCIGASTGGPPVIHRILNDLDPAATPPVFIVQHISSSFALSMADWLDKTCPFTVKLAGHLETARPGLVYMAPDGKHLKIDGGLRTLLTDEPPVRGLKPSVDLLFQSAAAALGPALVAVILTGMGSDGALGMKAVKEAGGHTLAQDEASSVIYGMPREAELLGAVDEQLSIEMLGRRVNRIVETGRRQRAGE